MGWGGCKMSKPIPTPPCGPCDASLKSCFIPATPTLRSWKNPCGAKWGGTSQVGWGKIVILSQEQLFFKKKFHALHFNCTEEFLVKMWLRLDQTWSTPRFYYKLIKFTDMPTATLPAQISSPIANSLPKPIT